MNPALPVLALGSLLPLLLRRRWGLAWAVSGLAAVLLLHAALTLPDGIASPSGTRGGIAPFVGTTAGGNPTLRDVTFQIEPWLLFLQRELRAGRLPFWNPWQFAGTPFWANGQSAPLFPLHWLFVVLPLQVGFLVLPWARVVLGGTGAFLLARRVGVRDDAALLAAVVYPLSGMCASYLLFPMGNALALVPWVLWAADRVLARPGTWPTLAGLAALQMLAGHPETVIHTGFVVALYAALRGRWRGAEGARVAAALAGGFALAAAMSAAAWVPMLALVRASGRWAEAAGGEPPLAVLLRLPLRVLLPHAFGDPVAGTWWGPFNASATAVYAGAGTLALAVAGLWTRRAERSFRGLAAVLLVAALAAYHAPGVRELLALVPLLGRALPHRLLFAVDLALAVLAAAGLEAWLEGRARGLLAGALVSAALLAVAWWWLGADWRVHGQRGAMLAASAAVVALCGVWIISLRLAPRARRLASVLVLGGVTVDLVLAHGPLLGALPAAKLTERTPALAALAGRDGRIVGLGAALRPNLAMVYGLADLRGDDPLHAGSFDRALAKLGAGADGMLAPHSDWSAPWLDAASVRWVIAPPGTPPVSAAWATVYDGADARLFERPSALPMARWEAGGGADGVRVLRREPGLWSLAWSAPAPSRLVVAERAERGWTRVGSGAAGAVETTADGWMAVPVPGGSGTVTLRYRPPGLGLGSAASALGIGVWLVAARRRA